MHLFIPNFVLIIRGNPPKQSVRLDELQTLFLKKNKPALIHNVSRLAKMIIVPAKYPQKAASARSLPNRKKRTR